MFATQSMLVSSEPLSMNGLERWQLMPPNSLVVTHPMVPTKGRCSSPMPSSLSSLSLSLSLLSLLSLSLSLSLLSLSLLSLSLLSLSLLSLSLSLVSLSLSHSRLSCSISLFIRRFIINAPVRVPPYYS